MKELKKYYETSKREWLCIIVSGWVILIIIFNIIGVVFSKLVTTWITDQDVKSNFEILLVFLSALVPTTIALVSYFSILDHINKEGWKKKFPQYDINGEWVGTISFTRGINDTGWNLSNKKSESIPVHIEQTCNTLRIKPSVGDNMTFYSILADFNYPNIPKNIIPFFCLSCRFPKRLLHSAFPIPVES